MRKNIFRNFKIDDKNHDKHRKKIPFSYTNERFITKQYKKLN